MVPNGNGWWKFIATAAISVLVGMGIQVLREPKDVVTEKELTYRILELQGKVEAQTARIDAMERELMTVHVTVNEQDVEIAKIGSKLGVSPIPSKGKVF